MNFAQIMSQVCSENQKASYDTNFVSTYTREFASRTHSYCLLKSKYKTVWQHSVHMHGKSTASNRQLRDCTAVQPYRVMSRHA